MFIDGAGKMYKIFIKWDQYQSYSIVNQRYKKWHYLKNCIKWMKFYHSLIHFDFWSKCRDEWFQGDKKGLGM